MSLYWATEDIIVRRNTYVDDKSTLATVFTSILSSVQQDDVPVGLSGGGYASRTYTVFMGNEKSIKADDRIVTTDGKELRVIGIKEVTSGNEPYLQCSCEEAMD